MAKSVLETINEYTKDADAKERLETADLELELCDQMVELRERAGLTQHAFAARLNYSQAYIAKLENGGYDNCGIGTLRKFVRALGYDIKIDRLFVPNGSPLATALESCSAAASAAAEERAQLRVIDGGRAA